MPGLLSDCPTGEKAAVKQCNRIHKGRARPRLRILIIATQSKQSGPTARIFTASFLRQERATLLVLLLVLASVGLTISVRMDYIQKNVASVSLLYSYVQSIAETRISLATLFDMLV